jgi:phosphoribosylaminoimidazole-succinocarboxamide synthase
MTQPLYQTSFPDLTLFRRGKVRDVYDLPNDHALLMIATDRISAFDVIMNEPVPEKGILLTKLSTFWFGITQHIVRNHLISSNVDSYPPECLPYADVLRGRSMMVEKTIPMPVECVVRGYLAGSGWKEYREHRTVCGIPLPHGLTNASQLPEPLFTPATKAETGHDENITFDEAVRILGAEPAERVRSLSLALYTFAADYAAQRGLILADTKFEFGVDTQGEIILIDEALTPDSSRYWLASEWKPGAAPVNFDKQVLRDYLETLDWNKQPPPPPLPQNILERTTAKYQEALRRLSAGTS